MLTRWTRAAYPRYCCTDELLPRGTPIQQLRIRGLARTLWRCPWCADEPPPEDLPPLPEPPAIETRVRRQPQWRATLDWKARQAGEDR